LLLQLVSVNNRLPFRPQAGGGLEVEAGCI